MLRPSKYGAPGVPGRGQGVGVWLCGAIIVIIIAGSGSF